MKKTNVILLILAVLVWGLFFSVTARAQLHVNVGVVDVSGRLDGTNLAWDTGYTHFMGRTGAGANLRYTSTLSGNYYTAEALVKHRVSDGGYRLDAGAGTGYNFDNGDIHPLVVVRSSFRLEEGTWLNLDFDNSFRKVAGQGKWRTETYLMVGLSVDIFGHGRRNLKKMKRFR